MVIYLYLIVFNFPLTNKIFPDSDSSTDRHSFGRTKDSNPLSIQYSNEYRLEYAMEHMDVTVDSDDDDDDDNDLEDTDQTGASSEDEDLDTIGSKYLIFSTGSKTYSPHQIGIKLVQNVNFPKRLDPGPTLKERIAANERKRRLQVRREISYHH